jgi:hypothetical protein
MKVIHEGTIGSYSFMMVDPSTIEVWSDFDNERPESFIFLKEGSIKTEKDFHTEISYWYMTNAG